MVRFSCGISLGQFLMGIVGRGMIFQILDGFVCFYLPFDDVFSMNVRRY